MNVLSLFDGMSCGQIALNRLGVGIDSYYAAEIDSHAIAVTLSNYPNTLQLGDVNNWQEWDIDFSKIDLIFAGFPCQAWSVAGSQQGDKDERGKLFWVMLDIIKHVKSLNPEVTFLIENVRMKKEFEDYITLHTTEALGVVYKYMINSALVSAQNRIRFYWTNIEGVSQPEDRGIFLKDIIEEGIVDRDRSYCIDASYFNGSNVQQYFTKSRRQLVFKEKSQTLVSTMHKENPKSMVKRGKNGLMVFNYSSSGRGNGVVESRINEAQKAYTLTATDYTNRAFTGVVEELQARKLTPLECERLQTVPEGYTSAVSNTQRYRMLGNGWTVDVIAHILNHKYGL